MPAQTIKIPFVGDPNKNVDEIALTQNAFVVHDGFIDEAGFLNRRPGLESYIDLGTDASIDGLYFWEEKNVTIAVSDGNVYSIDNTPTATLLGSGLERGKRVIFDAAESAGSDILAMANGGKIYTTDNATLTAMADGDAPTTVTHVSFFDTYLIANVVGDDKFQYSSVGDPLTWAALDFSRAERKADNIIAIFDLGTELILFGTRSIEWFYDDATTPFRRFQGGEVDTGVGAAYSLQYSDEINSWMYLDQNRKFVKLQGRSIQRISSQYDKEIQSFSGVSDAISDIVRVDGRTFYVTTFPSENRTLAYDYRLNKWYEWGQWKSTKSAYDRFRGNASTYDIAGKRHLIGDFENGKIYNMKSDVYQDDSSTIRTAIRTGFIGHGTGNRKISSMLKMRLRRGTAKDTSDTAGSVMLRYRNEEYSTFGVERTASTGIGGDNNFVVSFRRNGKYRARQWELASSDNTPFVVGELEERVELLGD